MAFEPNHQAGNEMAVDPEKAALWNPSNLRASQSEAPLLEKISSGRSSRGGAISRFRHGIWLAVLEIALVVVGLYEVLRTGGLLDSATRWLAHPKVIPQEPFQVLGHTVQVKLPRAEVSSSSNQTRM